MPKLGTLRVGTKVAIRRGAIVAMLIVFLGAVMIGSRWDGELEHRAPSQSATVEIGTPSFGALQLVFGVAVAGLALLLALTLAVTAKRAILGAAAVIVIVVIMFTAITGDVIAPVVETSDNFGTASQDRLVSVGEIPAFIGAIAAVALGVSAFLLWRYARRGEEAATVELALADSISSLASELGIASNGDRAAIISTYSKLEDLFANSGHARLDFETASDHLGRVLNEVGADNNDVAGLLDIYQRAAYGSETAAVKGALGAMRSQAAETMQRIAHQVSREATPLEAHSHG